MSKSTTAPTGSTTHSGDGAATADAPVLTTPKAATEPPKKKRKKRPPILRLLRQTLNPAAFKGSEYPSATAKAHGPADDHLLRYCQSIKRELARFLEGASFYKSMEWRAGLCRSPVEGPAVRLTFQHMTPSSTRQYHEGGLFTQYDWHRCALTGDWFRVPKGSPVPVVSLGDPESYLSDRLVVHPAIVAAGAPALSAALLRTMKRLYDVGMERLALAIKIGGALSGLPEEGIGAEWPSGAYRSYRNRAEAGQPADYGFVRVGYEVAG